MSNIKDKTISYNRASTRDGKHTGACRSGHRRPVCESQSLGILTKYASTPDIKGLAELAVRRTAKYSLQEEAKKLLPTERVRFCLRHRVDATKGIEVKYNQKRENRRITATCNAAVVYGLVLYARHRLARADGRN